MTSHRVGDTCVKILLLFYRIKIFFKKPYPFMEYIMMLLFTNIEPFFIFIQSLLGGGAESCGKNRIRQKYNEFRDGRRKP